MSLRRRLDWSTSMRDYRASAPVNPMSAPLVAGGKYHRPAIMKRAVAIARTLRAGGKAWAWRISVALKSAWAAARRELAAARPVAPARWSWRSEPDLMNRLTKAQNSPVNSRIDIMTFAGMCDSRAELEAHVTRYEHRVA